MDTKGKIETIRNKKMFYHDVSLYIPAFNAENFLERALQAVKRQSYPLSGVYVIDDGSTDNTVEIAQKMDAQVIHHPQNLGLGAARNTAFEIIKSKFIASLDADCEPEPDWLEHLMNHFDTDEYAGVGGKLLEKFQDRAVDHWRAMHMKQHRGDREILKPEFLFGCNNVFRRDAILDCGNYPTTAEYRSNYEDAYMSNKLYKRGYTLKYVPDAIVYHLRTDTQKSLFHASWRWYFNGKPEPIDLRNLAWKFKDSIYWSLKYVKNDIHHKNLRLIPISILYAPVLMGLDFSYYLKNRKH